MKGEGGMDDEEFEFEPNPRFRKTKSKSISFIIVSTIAVALHLTNVVVTCVFFSVYVDSYIETHGRQEDGLQPGDCFLFFNQSESAELCDFSLSGSSVLLFLEVVLVALGTASIALGRRALCPKCMEVGLTLFCLVLGTVISMIISFGYGGKCVDDSVCGNREKIVLIFCWAMVVLFFLPTLVHIIDCLGHLPSRRNLTRRNDHWLDKSHIQENSEETMMFLQ